MVTKLKDLSVPEDSYLNALCHFVSYSKEKHVGPDGSVSL